MQSRVGTRRKGAGDVLVAIRANFVAHKRCAFNLQRNHRRPVHAGAGNQQHANRPSAQGEGERRKAPRAAQALRPTQTLEQKTPAHFVNNSGFQFLVFKGLIDKQQDKSAASLNPIRP